MAPPEVLQVTAILGDARLADETKVGGVFAREDLESIDLMKAALGQLDRYRLRYLDDHSSLIDDLLNDPPPLVLNLCDTGFRNVAAHELHVPALLELLGIPYTGSGPLGLALCFDKAAVRAIGAELGVPVPAQRFLRSGERVEAADLGQLAFPALIKPNCGDGSIGITKASVVTDGAGAAARIAELRAELPGRDLLVQEFLTGPEYGITLVGNPGQGLDPLPPLTVDYGALDAGLPPILGYESKTLPNSPYWQKLRYVPAALDAETDAAMLAHARVLFERLNCRDYARFDFRAGAGGEAKLLEVNPNPAWCWDGKMNLMAGFAGISYPELLGRILDVARARVCGPG